MGVVAELPFGDLVVTTIGGDHLAVLIVSRRDTGGGRVGCSREEGRTEQVKAVALEPRIPTVVDDLLDGPIPCLALVRWSEDDEGPAKGSED